MAGDEINKMMDEMFKGYEEQAMAALSEGLKEYEKDQTRPCITKLPYKPIPALTVENIKNTRMGLFKGGFKKKLLSSIEDGRTKYTEVLLLARAEKLLGTHHTDYRENQYRMFYKIADLDGNVVRYDVQMVVGVQSFDFPYINGDSASDTGCADVVDPNGYQHMILLQYYIEDDQNFVLMTKEQFETLSDFLKNVPMFGYNHATGDGVGFKW